MELIGTIAVEGVQTEPFTEVGSTGSILTIDLHGVDRPAVYVFRVNRLPDDFDRVYVGQTMSLARRMSEYITGSFSNNSPQAYRIAQELKAGVRDFDWHVELSLATAEAVAAPLLPREPYDLNFVAHRKALEAFLVVYYGMDDAVVLNDDASDPNLDGDG